MLTIAMTAIVYWYYNRQDLFNNNQHSIISSHTSVRDLNPPKALPFHCLPVTNWKGRVAISWPAGATPAEKREDRGEGEGEEMK